MRSSRPSPGGRTCSTLIRTAAVLLIAVPILACRGDAAARTTPSSAWTPEVRGAALPTGMGTALDVDTLETVMSVEAAVQVDGGWVLLDPAASHLHVPTRSGGLQTYGGQGDGPGELFRPRYLDVSGTVVAVADGPGRRVDFFDLRTGYLGRVATPHPGCPMGLPRAVLADGPGTFVLLQTCTDPRRGSWARLVRVAPGHPGSVLREDVPAGSLRPLDPMAVPFLARHRGTLYLGTPAGRCLMPVGAGPGAAPWAVCHPDLHGPPLPDTLRVRLERLGERLAGLGNELVIPERLPPWVAVSTGGDRLVFVTPLAGGREALDILEGPAPGDGFLRRVLPPDDTRVFVGRDEMLVVRDLMEGTEVTRMKLP